MQIVLRRAAEITKAEGKDCFKVEGGKFGNHINDMGFVTVYVPQYEGDVSFCSDRGLAGSFSANKVMSEKK